MRHVDEGTIHAWLDGQITDRADAAAIEEHFRECAGCRSQLAEERAAFDRAQTLLAATAPVAQTPSLESLLTPSRSRRERVLMQAGWAASVVLAAGLGWAARDMRSGNAPPQEPVLAVAEPPAAPAPASVSAEPPPAVALPPASSRAERRVARQARVQDSVAPLASAPAPPSAPPPVATSAPPPAAAAEVQVVDLLAARQQTVAEWRPLSRTTAAAQTGMPLYGIEGIEPAETALSADGALVRTIYRLASGEVVELLQQRTALPLPPAVRPPAQAIGGIEQSLAAPGRGGGGRGVLAERVSAATPRTWSGVRDDVRITLRTTSAADLDALGAKLRVD